MSTSPAPSGAPLQHENHQRIRRRLAYWEAQPLEAQRLRSNYLDALTEMDTAAICLRAVGDLLNPDPECIGEKMRDSLAVLMGFLLDSYDRAREVMTAAAQTLEDMQITGEKSC